MWNVHGILCASCVFKSQNSTCWLYLKTSQVTSSMQVKYKSATWVNVWGAMKSSISTWLRVSENIVTWTQLCSFIPNTYPCSTSIHTYLDNNQLIYIPLRFNEIDKRITSKQLTSYYYRQVNGFLYSIPSACSLIASTQWAPAANEALVSIQTPYLTQLFKQCSL